MTTYYDLQQSILVQLSIIKEQETCIQQHLAPTPYALHCRVMEILITWSFISRCHIDLETIYRIFPVNLKHNTSPHL